MRNRWGLLALLLALLLMGIFFVSGQALINEIAYRLVLAWLAIRRVSTPELLWVVMIAVAGAMARASLVGGAGQAPAESRGAPAGPGRIEILRAWTACAGQDGATGTELAYIVGTLAVNVLAERERLAPEEVRHRLRAGTLSLPADVRTYLQAALSPTGSEPSRLGKLWQRLNHGSPASALAGGPEPVLDYLAASLGVKYDDG